jgi:hypothetical protein
VIKGAKSIAEYAIRKWLQSEGFEMRYFKLTVHNNEAMIVDSAGDTLRLVYDNDTKSVYVKE